MIVPYYKCRPKLVPEDSVRPETQTLVVIIRRKEFIGSFISKLKLESIEYKTLMLKVGMKSANILEWAQY